MRTWWYGYYEAMKARHLICTGPRRVEVADFELEPLPDDGVLVANDCTAVSTGTETYNWIHGAEPGNEPRFPRTTGYCNAGTVLEVGRRVSHVKSGDRVAGQGKHASHDILRADYQPVPPGVPARAAAWMVMCAIAMRGVRRGPVELGHAVAVLGLGVVGQLAATLARLAGAMPLIAIDLDGDRLARAGARGADVTLNPADVDDLQTAVRAHCRADGADIVIEATGKPDVYPTALGLVCAAGRLVALGSPRGTVNLDLFPEVHLREVCVVGAFQPITPERDHVYYHWTKDRDRALILRLMAAGRLPVEDLVTHVARPGQCHDIYTMLADRPGAALGVVFEWTAGGSPDAGA